MNYFLCTWRFLHKLINVLQKCHLCDICKLFWLHFHFSLKSVKQKCFAFATLAFSFRKDLLKFKWVCFANQLKSLSKWNDTQQLPFIRIQIKNCIFIFKNAINIQQNLHKQNSFIWFPFIHFNYFKLIFDRMKFRFQFALLCFLVLLKKEWTKKISYISSFFN